MRSLLAISALLILAGASQPAAAVEYPWCAVYGGWGLGGARNCGFTSFAQCQATISGVGGFCERNPFYAAAARPRTRKPPRY